jgi:O-antigen/teichoic acid export membrane protein
MPSLTQIKYAYRKGFWYFAWSILNFGFSSIDILLLGFFASTTHVAKFAVTYYAIQMITTTISNALGAVLPGIGSLIGRGESHRVQAVRNESILYSWWLAFSIAITILFVNGSFVRLWIDDDVFAGVFENLLIVMMALQMVFLRNDSLIINLALEQKEKVKVTLYSLIVIVVLSALLIPKYGIVGLCLSVMIGRLILNYFYPRIISSFFKSQQQGVSAIVRPLGWIIVVILMALAVYAGNYIKIEGWFLLMLSAGVLFSLSLAITFLAGFDKSQKESLINRLRSLKDKKQVE